MTLFIYLSEMFGRRVVDVNNRYVGRLFDIAMRVGEEVFPRTDSIVLRKGLIFRRYARIPYVDVSESKKSIKLKSEREKVSFEKRWPTYDFSLRKHILDQQVVDMHGQKVVRVNDIHLLQVDNQLYFAHVDVGFKGIIRRLGWTTLVNALVKFFSPNSTYLTKEELISWKNTHVLDVGRKKNVIQSDVAHKKLAKIPTAQLADIMEDLTIFEKGVFFKTFSFEMQRNIFADMSLSEKMDLVDQLEDQEAANLLENIPADEATDLLNNVTKEKRTSLLRCMHSKTSKELRKLLGFAQDTAGGLMTTEYLYLKQDALVKDGIQKIKDNVNFAGNIIFIYVVDDQHHLVGTTSLRRIINEPPEKSIIETCYPNKVFVRTDDSMEEIAILLEKYKFFSIPVLDDQDVIQGAITIDDVMEELIALAWSKYKDQI